MVTGTQDGLVNVFSLASGRSDPSFTLVGHAHNVSALHALPDGTIISGSWDKYVIAHATQGRPRLTSRFQGQRGCGRTSRSSGNSADTNRLSGPCSRSNPTSSSQVLHFGGTPLVLADPEVKLQGLLTTPSSCGSRTRTFARTRVTRRPCGGSL